MLIKSKIIEQAHHLFTTQGIRSVTMDDLAHSLGMSKRTIYEQFTDKRQLVKEDAQYFARTMKESAERAIAEADNVIEGVNRILHLFRDVMQTVTPSYFMDMKKYYPLAYAVISQKNDIRDFDITNKLVINGQEQGIFRKEMNTNLVSVFMNTVLFSDNENIREVKNLKFGEFERDVLFAYLMGIATEDGKVLILKEQDKYFENMTMRGTLMPKFKC